VSRQMRTRAMLARVSQRMRAGESIPDLADPSRRSRNWSSIPSPSVEALCMVGCGGRCEARGRAVYPLSAFAVGSMASDRLWFHCRVVRSASLYRRPSDKCLPRAPILPYFPCSPSVTRSALFPRHITPAHNERALGAPILRTASFCFSRTPPPTRSVGSPLRKMQLLPWERGALASLRARVSRG